MSTKEQIIDIYNKARKIGVALSTYGEDKFDKIVIYRDGTIDVIFKDYCYGSSDYEYIEINPDDLDKDVDQLAKEYEEKKKRDIEENNKRIEAEKLRLAKVQEDLERKNYLCLKEKFEK